VAGDDRVGRTVGKRRPLNPSPTSPLPHSFGMDAIPIEFSKVVLDNGLTLVIERHPYVRSVSLGVWVRVGSTSEPASVNGISHFIEHMVFKGTESRTPLQIATWLESVGGDLNAFTDREFTCYHATVLPQHLERAVEILSDLVLHPTFSAKELERERKVLLQELSMTEESPEEWISDLFFDTVFRKEPLGQTVIGNKKNIQKISRAQLFRFFQEHYRPDNMVVSVAGNVSVEAVKAVCEKFFVFPSSQRTLPIKRPVSNFKARKKAVVAPSSEQLHLMMGFPGVGFKDPRRFEALLTSFFLGGGMSSRLFQEVREIAALAYTVDCECVPFTDTGLMLIYVAMNPRSIKPCIEIISRELKRLAEVPLRDEDLEMVKGQLTGTILLSSDHMEVRQESLGRNELVFGRYIPVEEVIAEIAAVTPARVQAFAESTFRRGNEAVVVLARKPLKPATIKIL
jgi:predicted Zn-dependent peptidase